MLHWNLHAPLPASERLTLPHWVVTEMELELVSQ